MKVEVCHIVSMEKVKNLRLGIKLLVLFCFLASFYIFSCLLCLSNHSLNIGFEVNMEILIELVATKMKKFCHSYLVSFV